MLHFNFARVEHSCKVDRSLIMHIVTQCAIRNRTQGILTESFAVVPKGHIAVVQLWIADRPVQSFVQPRLRQLSVRRFTDLLGVSAESVNKESRVMAVHSSAFVCHVPYTRFVHRFYFAML